MINISNKSFNYIILFFYIFILLLIYERHLCFSLGLYTADKWNNPIYVYICDNLRLDFWSENKLVENIQSLLLLFSVIYFYLILKTLGYKNKYLFYFFLIHFFGLIYFLGEEISWGQHFFHWESSNFFIEMNHQKETNLHNISNFFNEFPRSILLLWCSFSGFFVLYFKKIKKYSKLICPNKKLLLISITLIIFVFPDLIFSKFNIEFNRITQRITFNFLRLSELQELIISFYFFIYSSAVYKNIKKILKSLNI